MRDEQQDRDEATISAATATRTPLDVVPFSVPEPGCSRNPPESRRGAEQRSFGPDDSHAAARIGSPELGRQRRRPLVDLYSATSTGST